jgi:hypothetical protein
MNAVETMINILIFVLILVVLRCLVVLVLAGFRFLVKEVRRGS